MAYSSASSSLTLFGSSWRNVDSHLFRYVWSWINGRIFITFCFLNEAVCHFEAKDICIPRSLVVLKIVASRIKFNHLKKLPASHQCRCTWAFYKWWGRYSKAYIGSPPERRPCPNDRPRLLGHAPQSQLRTEASGEACGGSNPACKSGSTRVHSMVGALLTPRWRFPRCVYRGCFIPGVCTWPLTEQARS